MSGGHGSFGAGPAGSPLGAVSGTSLGGAGGGGGLVFDGNGNVVSGGSGFGDVSTSYTGKLGGTASAPHHPNVWMILMFSPMLCLHVSLSGATPGTWTH